MPLTRRSHKSAEPLRKTLGRNLYTQAEVKSREKATAKAKTSAKSPDPADEDQDPTKPSSGVFTPPPPRAPQARTSGYAYIPVHGTLVDAEMRLSELYASKCLPEHARQLTLSVLYAVVDENILAGFSGTVAACAVAGLTGKGLGKVLLSRAAIQDLGVKSEAIAAAGRALLAEKEKLQRVLVQVDGREDGSAKAKARVQWLSKREPSMKVMWSPPGQSRLRQMTASEDLSVLEQQEAKTALAQVEIDRVIRRTKGEKVGGRPQRATRTRGSSTSGCQGSASQGSGASIEEQSNQPPVLPQRASSRKRIAPDA